MHAGHVTSRASICSIDEELSEPLEQVAAALDLNLSGGAVAAASPGASSSEVLHEFGSAVGRVLGLCCAGPGASVLGAGGGGGGDPPTGLKSEHF